MAKARIVDDDPGAAQAPAAVAVIQLSRPWSCDRGYFPAGERVELPLALARSLEAEGMGAVL